jgi:hypothetical protein
MTKGNTSAIAALLQNIRSYQVAKNTIAMSVVAMDSIPKVKEDQERVCLHKAQMELPYYEPKWIKKLLVERMS